MDLCNPKEIKALLARHGFHFSKSKGQNFLIQPWVPQQAAEASGAGPGVGVLEIGPGIGPLTAQLAQRGEKVAAVELDRALLPILAETMAPYPNVEIVPGDILKLDLPVFCRERFPGLPVVVCANLPYNITTPVLTALLQSGCFQAVTVMIQREVARRICAQPGTADYGAFTPLCQYYAHSEILFDVPPSCFLPTPKVTSAVLRCRVRPAPAVSPACGEAFFFQLRMRHRGDAHSQDESNAFTWVYFSIADHLLYPCTVEFFDADGELLSAIRQEGRMTVVYQ